MKIILLQFLLLMNITAFAFDHDGDEGGNGGFAYKQSIALLDYSTTILSKKVAKSNLTMFNKFPTRRRILLEALKYDNIIQLPRAEVYRDDRLLMFDYDMESMRITAYKPYFASFAGTSDSEMRVKSKEVQKRLLHEISHLWGFMETQSEEFAESFLTHHNNLTVYQKSQLRLELRVPEIPVFSMQGVDDSGKRCIVALTYESVQPLDKILQRDTYLLVIYNHLMQAIYSVGSSDTADGRGGCMITHIDEEDEHLTFTHSVVGHPCWAHPDRISPSGGVHFRRLAGKRLRVDALSSPETSIGHCILSEKYQRILMR